MTTKKSIEMIDEYLLEPNNINKERVECLQLCKQALVDNVKQKAEIERLQNERIEKIRELTRVVYDKEIAKAQSEAIKEFAEKLTNRISYKLDQSANNPDGNNYFITDVYIDIDNLKKEMTEQSVNYESSKTERK